MQETSPADREKHISKFKNAHDQGCHGNRRHQRLLLQEHPRLLNAEYLLLASQPKEESIFQRQISAGKCH
jgi:hypothetical protein